MAKKSLVDGLDKLLDPIFGSGGRENWEKQGQQVEKAAAQYDDLEAPTLGEYKP